MSDLVSEFKTSLISELKHFSAGQEKQDVNALRALAHRLSGAAYLFGFAELSRRATQLETNIKNGKLSFLELEPQIDELINEISYWVNILNDTPNTSRKMSMLKDYRWFEIISSNNNRITTLDCVFYKDTYVSSSSTDVTIKFQRFNNTTSVYEDIDSQIITFQNSVQEEQISKTFTYTLPQLTNKYRLIYDTSIQLGLPFNLYIIKLQANKQIPIFDNGTEDTPSENTITLPDGFYKSSNYKKTLNDLLNNYKIKVSIDEYTNKIKFTNENITFIVGINNLIDNNFKLELVIPNINNLKNNLGITESYQSYILLPFNSYYESDTNINLINFTKIIIVSNLSFKNKTHNDILNNGNVYGRGIGDVLAWMDTDDAPFTYIKYKNYEQIEYELQNNHINYITFRFYNEKSQELFLDNCLISFEIKKDIIIK